MVVSLLDLLSLYIFFISLFNLNYKIRKSSIQYILTKRQIVLSFCEFCNENFSLCHLSKAFTLPSSFLLFLQLMRTCVLFLTDCVRTESGPVLNSSCSLCANSSGVISLFGFCIKLLKSDNICVRTSTKIFVSC